MAVYTRQSSSGIVDGGVIEAVDLNNEFDQLASAFLAPTFGVGTSGTDIVMTFDGETNDEVTLPLAKLASGTGYIITYCCRTHNYLATLWRGSVCSLVNRQYCSHRASIQVSKLVSMG